MRSGLKIIKYLMWHSFWFGMLDFFQEMIFVKQQQMTKNQETRILQDT